MLSCCSSSSWWLSCSAEDEKFEWQKHCCSWSWWISKNIQEEDVNEEDEIWDEHWMYIISYLTSFSAVIDKTDLHIVMIIHRQCLDVENVFICNLKNNSLKQAWLNVVDIHISYFYVADFQLRLLFVLHAENWELYSLNFLHQKTNKHWVIIRLLNQVKLKKKLILYFCQQFSVNWMRLWCSQFVHHMNLWILFVMLNQWRIHYIMMKQQFENLIITLLEAYHQDWNVSSNIIKAINYRKKMTLNDAAVYQPCFCDCWSDLIKRDLKLKTLQVQSSTNI